MPNITIDQEACNNCGACMALCFAAQVFSENDDGVEAAAPQECWLCGHCVAACPSDAIDHSGFPAAECPPLDRAALPTLDQLATAFRQRRSHRVFRKKPVPREMVRELVDLARWAPTASNKQPVDWLAFDDPERIAALSTQTVAVLAQDGERLARQQAQGKDPVFYWAPVLLLAHVPDDKSFGRDDAAYATYNLMLGAERMGLGTCLIGYFVAAYKDSYELRRTLGLPLGRRVEVAIILGFPRYRFVRLLPRRRMDISWNPEA